MRAWLSIVVLLLGGCQMAGVAIYKLRGPPKIPAKYKPAKEPTLLLVENYQHQSAVNAEAETLARKLMNDLESNDVAPIVSIDKLQELRDAKPAEFPHMTIVQIAQAVQAKQVIYVQLRSADVTPLAGGVGYTGDATAIVKVIDGTTGAVLWPIESSDGYGVGARTSIGKATYPSPADVRNVLYAQLTDQISKLFRDWQPEYEGSEEHSTELSQ
jgi:hypothetical protein